MNVYDEQGCRLLTAEAAAALRGVRVDTWHRSVARGSYPPPYGHVGRTPVWRESTVRGHRKEGSRP